MRLFVALNFPEWLKAAVQSATEPLRLAPLPVRWVEPDAYHLTLKFLGEVPEDRLDTMKTAVGDVAAAYHVFPLRLQHAGAFPNPRRPTVFWIGIERSAQLLQLRDAVEAALSTLGFPTEARPFAPHLTLGRTQRDALPGALGSAGALLNDVAFDHTINIESLDLMRSHLTPRGARYERLLASPLRP